MIRCSSCASGNVRLASIDGRAGFYCVDCGYGSPTSYDVAAKTPLGVPVLSKAEAQSERKKLEDELAQQLHLLGVPEPVREFRPIKARQWRVDFAWPLPSVFLLVEVEGGVWTKGRHVRGQGYIDDTRKYNSLALAGWTVLRYTAEDIWPEKGQMIGAAANEISKRLI